MSRTISSHDSTFKKLLKAAKDATCINCCAQDGTVVAAHRNEGKGMGLKVPDYQVLYLCHICHYNFDSGKEMTKEERREFFNRLYVKQVEYWFQAGLIEVVK